MCTGDGRALVNAASGTVGGPLRIRIKGARGTGRTPRLRGEPRPRGIGAGVGGLRECFGGRFTGTPNGGFALADDGARDDRIGWRLTSAVPNDPGFEVRPDATRREPASSNVPPEHGAIDTGGTNGRCGCNGASAAHAAGFVRSGPNP